MAYQKTLCILKPGVLQRRIVGELISRIERKGLKIHAMKLMQIPRSVCEEHYAEHKDKPFYESLVGYMTSAPVIAMVVGGEEAIPFLRTVAGKTKPAEAAPGTIRGDFALITQNNIIHAADSPESAAREIALFFDEAEILDYDDPNADWIS
ncbi:MAG: nucleoside-diphosphate kinase [Spirochaetes bacterium]|jgi:nucleoside-diphosphate kinase|nr:nucleoside-diphosphate kinase [Spirochaetota bacterium]